MSRAEMVWGLMAVAAIAMLAYVVIPAVGVVDDNSSRLDALEAWMVDGEYIRGDNWIYDTKTHVTHCFDTSFLEPPAITPDQYIVRIDTTGWYKGCVNRRIIFDTLFVAPRGCLDTIASAQWAKTCREMAWSNSDIINMWVRYDDTRTLSYYICERYHCDSIWLPRTKTIYADKRLLWVTDDQLKWLLESVEYGIALGHTSTP